MCFIVYLSGEIHSDWRDTIISSADELGLPIEFESPETDHDASDAAGDMLGNQSEPFWRDHQSAKVNAIRTRTLIERADLVVIKFGENYKQWNAAFDAGYCTGKGIPYLTLHSADLVHPLKEVDASAMAWAQTPQQVVQVLKYLLGADY